MNRGIALSPSGREKKNNQVLKSDLPNSLQRAWGYLLVKFINVSQIYDMLHVQEDRSVDMHFFWCAINHHELENIKDLFFLKTSDMVTASIIHYCVQTNLNFSALRKPESAQLSDSDVSSASPPFFISWQREKSARSFAQLRLKKGNR